MLTGCQGLWSLQRQMRVKQKCHLLVDKGTGTQQPSRALSGCKCSGLSLCCLGRGGVGTSLFFSLYIPISP